jgi:excisionase family DNA binding protein
MWNDGGPSEKLLTKGEVAQLCRVEIRTVDRWVAARKLTSYRTPSGRLLFRQQDVLMTADRWKERVVHGGRFDGHAARERGKRRGGPDPTRQSGAS